MVEIDNDFARFGSKSYAINKITSVDVREKPSGNGGCVVAMAGCATLVFALATIAAPPLIVVTAGLGWLTYIAWKRSKRVTYQLFIITSASETQAYESADPHHVQDLRNQVEAAMLHHSRGFNSGG